MFRRATLTYVYFGLLIGLTIEAINEENRSTIHWCPTPQPPHRIVNRTMPERLNLLPEEQDWYPQNATLIIGCDSGKEFVEGSQVTCVKPDPKEDAYWNGTFPKCPQSGFCVWFETANKVEFRYEGDVISEDINGYPEKTELVYISWDCPPGYSVTKNSRYCTFKGFWNGTEPNCVASTGIEDTQVNWLFIWASIMSIISFGVTFALVIICCKRRVDRRARTRAENHRRYDVVRRVNGPYRFSVAGQSGIVRESLVQSPNQDLSVRIEDSDTYNQPFDTMNLPSPSYAEIDDITAVNTNNARGSAHVNA